MNSGDEALGDPWFTIIAPTYLSTKFKHSPLLESNRISFPIGKRSEIYLNLYCYPKALAIFDQILDKEPDDDDGWPLYLRALATRALDPNRDTAQANLTQAIKLAQTAQEKDPKNWYNNFNLALYHLAAGHSSQAQTQYQTTLTTAPPLGHPHRPPRPERLPATLPRR